ncbi:MAG: leucine-rich repeat protein, partial [Clostridiales bacterium]|nr:leucine-rich repeat protein [Clostridiales bacterium]
PVLGVTDYTVKVNGVTVKTITDGKTSTRITLTKAGDNKITVSNANESEEINVYAYTVKFDTQGGSAVNDQYLAIGDTLTLPDTALLGYVFNGWYNSIGGANGNGQKYEGDMTLQSAGDMMLFVDWTPDIYSAKYDYGDGKGVSTSGTLQYTKPYKLEVPTPNDARDIFVGWFSAPTGGIRYTNELGEGYGGWQNRFGVTMYAQYLRVFNFVYLENSKTYAVAKCANTMVSSSIKQITVPKSYDDDVHGERLVTVVDAYAFQSCSTLERITIYDTVTNIEVDSSAFDKCSNLKEINIEHVSTVVEPIYSSPNGVLVVYDNKQDAYELKYVPAGRTGTLDIPNIVTAISERAFNAGKINTVNIPTSVTHIYGNAFYNCADLHSVNFNKNLEGTDIESVIIEDNAFRNCTGLTTIAFPARMESFNANMFYSCTAINTVDVEQGGKYSIVDDMLVETAAKEIVYFPVAKTTCNITSAAITSIGEKAFYKATNLTSITIPSWITNVRQSAFEGCKTLNTVVFAGAEDNLFSLSLGESSFASCAGLSSVTFADGSNVVALGDKAFYKCTALTAFTVPNTVTSIGNSAFDGCSNIKTFTFGAEVATVGNYAFNGCRGLTVVELPAKLTKLGDYAFCSCKNLRTVSYADRAEDGAKLSLGVSAFEGCEGLTSFTIRLFITNVGSGVFTDCKNLAHVTVEKGHKNYTEYDDIIYKIDSKGAYESLIYFPYTKSGAVVLPDTLTSIGGGVFKGNNNITSIIIGKNVETIGANAFQNCKGLRTVEFEEGGTKSITIGANTFQNCDKLNSINIPSRLTQIPNFFLYGTAITSVEIPASITSIGNSAFNNCKSLGSVTFAKKEDGTNDLHTIGNSTFGSDTALTEFTVTAKVASMGTGVFSSCTALTTVNFEDSNVDLVIAEATSGGIFGGCTALVNITLPERLTRIPGYMFSRCSSLTTVNLGSKIKNGTGTQYAVGKEAFSGCTSLVSVTYTAGSTEGNVSFGQDVFKDCISLESLGLPKRTAALKDDPASFIYYYSSAYKITENYNVVSPLTSLREFNVEEGGTYYSDDQGILYYTGTDGNGDKINKWMLLFCPITKNGTVTISKETTYLGSTAFYKSGVTNVVFEENEEDEYTDETQAAALPNLVMNSLSSTGTFTGSALTEIILPARLTSIGVYAFQNCTSLESVTFDTQHGDSRLTSVGGNSFQNTALTTFEFPNITSVTSVGSQIFSGVTLTSLVLPNAMVDKIYDITLASNIPATAVRIHGDSTDGTVQIVKYTNNSDGSRNLVWYSPNNASPNFVVPFDVKSISPRAFNGCANLRKITFENIPAENDDDEDKSSKLTTIGAYAFNGCTNLKEIIIPSDCPMTSIEANAFNGCSGLENITIPKNVTTIGGSAFNGCSSLLSITFTPKVQSDYALKSIGANAFQNCRKLDNVVIPNSVTSLGNIAFSGCSALSSITIGTGIKSFGASTFANCTSLTSITIPSTVTTIGNSVFSGCTSLGSITIPSTVSSLGTGVFNGCSNLTTANIEANINSLGTTLFQNCTALTSVTIPNSVKTIGSSFIGCSNLSSITLPSGLTAINASAFENCTKLNTINIPSTVTAIGNSAFKNTGVSSIVLPEGLLTIGEEAFGGTKIVTIDIPGSVTTFGNNSGSGKTYGVFNGCDKLEKIKFNQGTATLTIKSCTSATSSTTDYEPYRMFIGCPNLTEIDFGNRTVAFPNYLFDGASSLTTLKGLGGLTTIGTYAFRNCDNLATVTIPASVTTIQLNSFKQYNGLKNLIFENSDDAITLTITTTTASSNGAFIDCVNLETIDFGGRSVSIGNYAFYNRSKLESIENADNIETLGNSAFYGCGIVELTLPTAVTSFGSNVFANNTALTSVSISTDAYADFGTYTFADCTNLSTVEFTGIGGMLTDIGDGAFQNCVSITEFTVPDCIRNIGVNALSGTKIVTLSLSEGLTSIDNGAFENCDVLTTINIPASVTNLGDNPFAGCTALSAIDVAAGNTLYKSTDGKAIYDMSETRIIGVLSSTSGVISLPNTITSIAAAAFAKTAITSVTVLDSVQVIPSGAFKDCTELTSVTLSEGLVSIGDGAFSGCSKLTTITIPSTVTTIGANAFDGCGLTSVTFATRTEENKEVYSLAVIGDSAFKDCAFANINLPSTVISIGSAAFKNCINLTTVEIPYQVYELKDELFMGCEDLKNLDFASGIKIDTIGSNVFNGSGIETIVLPASIWNIAGPVFSGASQLTTVEFASGTLPIYISATLSSANYQYDADYISTGVSVVSPFDGTAITTVKFNSRSAYLGEGAFANCTSLTTVDWASIRQIGNAAFYRCTALESFSLSDSIQIIGSHAFRRSGIKGEVSLEKYTKLKEIGENAFEGCANITKLVVPGTVVKIQNYAFANCTGLLNADLKKGVMYLWSYTATSPNTTASSGGTFKGCTSLTTISLPSTLYDIPRRAFENCESLAEITIPCGKVDIAAFKGCSLLGTISFGTITGYLTLSNECFAECSSLTSVNLPDNANYISIGTSIFRNNTSLETIEIPNTMRTLSGSMFEGCSNLKSVTFRGTFPTKLNTDTFKGCHALTEIELYLDSNTVTGSNYPFSDWTSAQTIRILNYTEKPEDWRDDWHGEANVVWGPKNAVTEEGDGDVNQTQLAA